VADIIKYWPGAIPSHIQYHPEPIDRRQDQKGAINGYQLFLKVRETFPSYQSRQEMQTDSFLTNQQKNTVTRNIHA
jgi:hypothetical protein